MDCYPTSIRYLAVCLVMLYALTGGHFLCALCHFSHSAELTKHDCSHSQCQPPEVPPPTPCCSDNCEGHPCDTGELPDVILQRTNDESVNPFLVSSVVFDSDVSLGYQQGHVGYHETITFNLSALSLRLHLLYRVLLI